MLKVSFLPSQDRTFHFLSAGYPSAMGFPAHYAQDDFYWVVPTGGLLLSVPTGDSGSQLPESQSFDIGWLNQGKLRWGRHRDTDVRHVHADAEIVVGSTDTLPSWPAVGTGVQGSVYDLSFLGRSSAELISLSASWGSDATVEHNYALVEYDTNAFTNTSETWTVSASPAFVIQTHSLRFDRDSAVYCFTRTPWFVNVPMLGLHNRQRGLGFSCHIRKDAQGRLWRGPVIDRGSNFDHATILPDYTAYGYVLDQEFLGSGSPTGGVGGTHEDYLRIVQDVRSGSLLAKGVNHFTEQSLPDFLSDEVLLKDIMKQWKYADANVLLTVLDLMNGSETIKSWSNLASIFTRNTSLAVRGMKSFRGLPSSKVLQSYLKTGTNAFLSAKYGILPNFSDLRAVYEGLIKFGNSGSDDPETVYHSRRTTMSSVPPATIMTVDSLSVVMDTFGNGVIGAYRRRISEMKRWGLWPNTAMLWDAVPGSFVADWLTNWSGTFKDVDTNFDLLMEYFPTQYWIYSRKRTWESTANELWPLHGATGAVKFTDYTRFCDKSYPMLPITVGKDNAPSAQDVHWVEWGALVVQRAIRRPHR